LAVILDTDKPSRKLNRNYDILLNVFTPLGLGTTIYFFPTNYLLRNYLPDGLWAYALTSLVLIIWSRQTNLFWLTMIFLCFLIFEFLQQIEIIKGTSDVVDIITYIIFAIFALTINKFLKPKF